ncbi:MAG: lytic transglycosylase domain-containing protein [Steroidobacteraceae bacterium]
MAAAHRTALVVALALASGPGLARADIFTYTDAQGTTHFSNVPVNPQYRLLVAGPSDPGASAKASGKWLGRSARFDSLIDSAAQTHDIQAALIRAVILVESGFNPRAVSRRGAVGLMQLLPDTAKRYGVSDIYDPEQNISAGAHYLRDLMVRFGSDLNLTLAAYNAGENAVERYGGRIPPFKETQKYVPSVLRIYRALISRHGDSEPG